MINRAVQGGYAYSSDEEEFNWVDYLRDSQDPSKAQITIPLEHSKIHQGKGWEVSIETGSIASTANFDILFRVAAGTRPHLRNYSITATGAPFTVRLYEGPTVDPAGTPVTPYNRNRVSDAPDGVTVFTGPTVTATGTRLETEYLAGDKAGGNVESSYEEWVLKPGDYLLRLTNGSNQSQSAFVNAFWYV